LRDLKLEEEVLKGGLNIPTSSTIIEEEIRKEIISISIYHTGTKWQIADSPSQTF